MLGGREERRMGGWVSIIHPEPPPSTLLQRPPPTPRHRSWILALTYGYSFGVELTVDNIIVEYMFDQFGLSLTVAGALGGMFGMMNLFSRASGGMISGESC